MKINPLTLKYLRWSLVLLVLSILLSAGIGWGSFEMLKLGQKKYQNMLTQKNEIQGKLARASQEEQELRAKILRFQELAARGLVGAENRLDWIEQIARVRTQRRIIDLEYEFDPQHPVDNLTLPAGANAGTYRFLSSTQKIRLKMLHEGDLLGLIDDLRTTVRAHLQLRSCELERIPPNPLERGINANLSANCVLDWITVQEGT